MVDRPVELRRQLPLTDTRAVGGPVALRLLAGYFGASLVGLVAACVTLVVAAPDLARGDLGAEAPVLAAHLLALAFLPLAVSGGTFHLLPVMLRNPLRSELRLQLALPLVAIGAWLAAPGIAFHTPAMLWTGATLLACGLMLVIVELGGIVLRAPAGRMLVASRAGVGLSLFHAFAALTLGAIVFDRGEASSLGVVHDRWVLVHLHLAVVGWLALLILAVGRTLGPMLALAPAASRRRLPHEELVLTLGLWLLLAGIAASVTPLALAGAAMVVLALGSFGRLLVRVVRTRRIAPEGPLLHLAAGAVFLVQAAALGFALLAGAGEEQRELGAYVTLLLLGWAAGVTAGHLPKLLSLSAWVWWPPGPRPKQSELYPRRLAQAEASVFAAGVELLAIGVYLGSAAIARAGAALVLAAVLAEVAAAWLTWQRRSSTT